MSAFKTETQLQSSASQRTQLFLSIVIPAFNERDNLPKTLEELESAIGRSANVRDYEVVVVDDHSTDGTFELIKSLDNPRIRAIRLSRQCGSHAALRAGIALAQGDATLCLSADGQEDPAVLGAMLGKLNAGAHVVWGVRRKREEPFFTRMLVGLAYGLIQSLAPSNVSEINLSNADFYLLSKKAVEAINHCPERHTSLFGLILWLGFKQEAVLYDRRARRMGKSKWRFRGLFQLLVDWIVAFSGIPLKLISILGFLTAALGFSYAVFIVGYTLLGYAKPGWAETVVLILVLGGAQMMMLGVIGEYLWRTLDETRQRPLYFIEARTDE